MKLIAKTQNGFMADLSNREIALILGFRSVSDAGYAKQTIDIGSELNVSGPYDSAEYMRNLKANKLKTLRSSLTNAIADIDKAAGLVDEMNLFETLKEI